MSRTNEAAEPPGPLTTRPSPTAVLKPLAGGAVAAAIVVAGALATVAVTGAALGLVLLLALLPVAGIAGAAAVSLLVLSLTTTYQLDEQGIRVSYALVSKSEQRVKWRKVTSVHVHEGPVDRMLGLATVTVTAYGTGTTLRLLAIPQAAIVRDEVDRRMVAHASLETWLGDD